MLSLNVYSPSYFTPCVSVPYTRPLSKIMTPMPAPPPPWKVNPYIPSLISVPFCFNLFNSTWRRLKGRRRKSRAYASAGPGIARSPANHRVTALGVTPINRAKSAWEIPSSSRIAFNSLLVIAQCSLIDRTMSIEKSAQCSFLNENVDFERSFPHDCCKWNGNARSASGLGEARGLSLFKGIF